jgi:hypothetical protein
MWASLTIRGMSGELPLRPMTLGELLDAAVELVRLRARPLLVLSAVLAVFEQLVLFAPRRAAGLTPPFYGPVLGHLSGWWAVTAAGFGLEATIITVLGAVAGWSAARLVSGQPPRRMPLGRLAVALAAAIVFGLGCALAAYLGFVPWVVLYPLFGLAGAVAAIEGGVFPLGRSAALAVRSGVRGWRILLAGYVSWFLIRVAFGAGWTAVADRFFGARPQWGIWLAPIAWVLGDTVAYAALGCLAAVLVLDIRMRTEGLDIALHRTRSLGADPAAALAHHR